MRHTLARGATAAILVGIVWALWPPTDQPPLPAGGERPRPEVPGGGPATADAVADTAPARQSTTVDESWWLASLALDQRPPLRATDDDPAGAVLRGRLTSRQRPWIHPSGVDVRLTRTWLDTVVPVEAADGIAAPDRGEPSVDTDPEGWFTLRFRPQAGELFLLIDRDGLWMDFQKVPRVPAPGTTLDLDEVWLDDRGGIAGELVDSAGQPVPDATVRAVDDPLADVASGLEDLRAERTRGVELFRVPGAMPSGPVPDWVVRRDHFLPFPVAKTDKKGRFRLRGLRPGSHDLFFQAQTTHGSLRDVLVAALCDTQVGTVRCKTTSRAELRFSNERGPWVGASVAFVDAECGFGPPVLRTNVHGSLVGSVSVPLGARILFAHPSSGPWLDVGALGGTPDHIFVPAASEMMVTLADASGAPIIGGTVAFFVTGEQFRPVDRKLPAWMQPVERSPGVHVGQSMCSVVAVAQAPGYAPAMTGVRHGEAVAMTMLPLQRLRVRTRDIHGATVVGASVRLQVHQRPDMRFAGAQWEALANDRVFVGTTDREGLLTVPVWPACFSLQATHPDFAPSAGPKICPVPEEVVNLTMRRAARIVGQMRMQQRLVHAGFRVRARQRPPAGNELDGTGFLAEQLAVTGADGGFAFRDLCAGIWELTPELPGVPAANGAVSPRASFRSMQVLLDEGQEFHCTIEAEREAMTMPQIRGMVRQNGVPTAGALLRLREMPRAAIEQPRSRKRRYDAAPRQEPEPVWSGRLVTDHVGDFEFAGLAPDTEYEVRIDLAQGNTLQFLQRRVVRTPLAVGAPPTPLDVDIATGALQAHCLEAGQPFANRMVRLRQVLANGQEGARFDMLTTEHGQCLVDCLPVGTWTAEPLHGGRFQPAAFEIHAGAMQTMMLDLQR